MELSSVQPTPDTPLIATVQTLKLPPLTAFRGTGIPGTGPR
jgi:hypothetical protein